MHVQTQATPNRQKLIGAFLLSEVPVRLSAQSKGLCYEYSISQYFKTIPPPIALGNIKKDMDEFIFFKFVKRD